MVEKVAPVRRDFDRMDQIPEMVFRVLQMFNFLIILYITLISSHALWGYVHEGTALEFLLRAGRVPPINWIIPIAGLLFFGCLEILLSVECNNHPELVCKLTLEFLVAIGISYVTGFGYTGMVVLLLADIMRYTID